MRDARRRLLAALACAAPLGLVQGCIPRLPDDLCEQPLTGPDPGKPLLIDVHAHAFNGSDLQIREFFAKADGFMDASWGDAARHIGALLQLLTWSFAPCGRTELELLEPYACKEIPSGAKIRALRAHAFGAAKAQLLAAAERYVPPPRSGGPKNFGFDEDGRRLIEVLSTLSFGTYERSRQMRLSGHVPLTLRHSKELELLQKTPLSLLDYVVQHFNLRYVNVVDYFTQYAEHSGETPDLVVTSLLDFDWWLAGGCPTPTRIPEQIEVMERVSVLTGGRVHAFAPFCPLRELLTSEGDEPGESLRWVMDAVGNRGFIGVKLYPPLGFAPWGNAEIQKRNPKLWSHSWLPPDARRSDFGARLDRALCRLYAWCVANEVPVMSHTSRSMGPKEFFEMASAANWGKAVEKFPGLRVNFGHFGGHGDIGERAPGYIEIMRKKATVYADQSYFFDAVDAHEKLESDLKKVLGDGTIARDKLMYGSDYLELVMERSWATYLKEYRALIRSLGEHYKLDDLETSFFGLNAARYLGLDGAARVPNNRTRLRTFYEKNRLPKPAWAHKVEAQ